MQILILGGTHFIGHAVVARLAAAGHGVTLFHRGRGETDTPPMVAHLHGDRDQLANFRPAFRRLAPDVVLDMVALVERDAAAVMQTFVGVAGRVVTISSGDVYRAYGRLLGSEPGPPESTPLTEDARLRTRLYPYRQASPRAADDPTRWADDYEKILVERVVLGEPGLPGTILRLPAVYGPRDGQHRLLPYLKRMDDARPAILLDERLARWRWTRGYVENVAAAIALAVTDERASGRVYNVGEAETLTEAAWVLAIADVTGWRGDIVTLPPADVPSHLAPTHQLDQTLVIDSSRIRRELGFGEEIALDEGLERTIAWERANPPAQGAPGEFDYAAEDAALQSVGRHGA